MPLLRKRLENLLVQASINIDENKIQLLLNYIKLLHKWNKAYNLTAITDPMDMLVKHIIDSIVVEPYLKGHRFIDVGTGPGLPGVPLAILRPDDHFVLLDSLGKRIRFLKQVKHELMLENIEPIQSRVEDFLPDEKDLFDGIVSRAFSSLQNMTNLCFHLLRKEGCFYALKGIVHDDEIKSLPNNIGVLDIIKLVIPELNAERHLIVLSRKINN